MLKGKILVFEPQVFYSSYIEDILKIEGFQVKCLKSTKDVVPAIKEGFYDVLIADISNFKEKDVGFLEILKKSFPTLPIITLVSSEKKDLVVRYIRLGVFDCIEKPIIREELIFSVQRAIQFSYYRREEKERITRLKRLAEGSETLLEASRLKDVNIPLKYPGSMLIQSILDSIVIAFDAEKVSLSWLDESKKKYFVVACAGYCMDIKLFAPRKIGEGVLGYVAHKKEAVYVTDITKDGRFSSSPFKKQYKSSSFMCGPVMLNKEVVAIVSVSDRKDDKPYREEDFFLFKSFLAQITFALESTTLINNLEHNYERLSVYKELSTLIINLVDAGEIINKMAQVISKNTGASGCAFYVLDENKENFLCEGSYGLKFKENFVYHDFLNKFLEGTQNSTRAKSLFKALSNFISGVELKNFVSFPIFLKNFPLGFLLLVNVNRDKDIDSDTMSDICQLVSIAFKNNWLYKNLCDTADELVKANRELEELNEKLLKELSLKK